MSRPSPSSVSISRSALRASFGPAGGPVPRKSMAHGCRSSAARMMLAYPRRSARQSPDGSGASASACTRSSISRCSSSFELTYQ
jgi:hypothetical protein